ncbi:MAG: lcfB 1 [Phenylobacterium sp.]|nr:lcfB 1 [Phenylobacterium sp.]
MVAAEAERQPNFPPYTPTIPVMLRHVVQAYGERELHVCGEDRLTFAGLERRSARLAKGLLARGIGKGARIGILMHNTPDFTVAFMAAARIGAIACPLSTLYQAPELRWVLNHADIQLLLIGDRFLGHDYLARLETAFPTLVGQTAGALALPEAPYLRAILVYGAGDRDWAEPALATLHAAADARTEIDDAFLAAVESNVVPADLLCMIHTSGSMAHPKGVVHSHGPVIRHSWQKAHDYWGIEPGERFICNRPFFWIAGLAAVLFHSVHQGCCMLTPAEVVTPEFALQMIETEGATAVCGDDALFKRLRAAPVLKDKGYDIFRLSNDISAIGQRDAAGAHFLNARRAARTPVAEHLREELIARSYGMTETISAHTSLPRGQLLAPGKANRCGRPMPGVILRYVDPETGRDVPVGEVGEIWAGGYSLMQGLYKMEREETFTADGFYRTGDLAARDEDGDILFSNRMGEMIKISGANVAPLEVELCLNQLPTVERSAVVPVTSPAGAPLLAAAVQLRAGETFDEAAIRQALREQLSSFKVPKRIFALAAEEFPVTGSGKIRKSELAPILAARLAAEAPALAS